LIWIHFILSCVLFAAEADWTAHALRLTGESDKIRATAIQALKATPELKQTLRETLKQDSRERALALDVIAALSLDEFTSELLALADQDKDGRFHLAVNALLHSGNRQKITKHYLETLKTPAPVVVRVIALDTLSRMEVNLTREELTTLLKDPAYEVRSATVSFIRSLLLRFPRKEDVALFALPLADRPYQLRLQTIYAIKDLPPSLEIDGLFLLEMCREDTHPEVRKACGGKP